MILHISKLMETSLILICSACKNRKDDFMMWNYFKTFWKVRGNIHGTLVYVELYNAEYLPR